MQFLYILLAFLTSTEKNTKSCEESQIHRWNCENYEIGISKKLKLTLIRAIWLTFVSTQFTFWDWFYIFSWYKVTC